MNMVLLPSLILAGAVAAHTVPAPTLDPMRLLGTWVYTGGEPHVEVAFTKDCSFAIRYAIGGQEPRVLRGEWAFDDEELAWGYYQDATNPAAGLRFDRDTVVGVGAHTLTLLNRVGEQHVYKRMKSPGRFAAPHPKPIHTLRQGSTCRFRQPAPPQPPLATTPAMGRAPAPALPPVAARVPMQAAPQASAPAGATLKDRVASEVIENIRANYLYALPAEAFDRPITDIVASLDRHSLLLPREVWSGKSRSGLGITFQATHDGLLITELLPNSPAREANLRPGDVIAAIDGRSTAGLRSLEALTRLWGEAGTTKEFTIARGKQTFRVQVRLRYLENPDPELVPMGRAAYIKLYGFAQGTADQVARLITKGEGLGVERYILDLRSASLGLLDDAVELCAVFGGSQPAIRLEGRSPGTRGAKYGGRLQVTRKDLRVLVDRTTTGAGEIVAACLQDNHRAKLIGTPTAGKGTVQTITTLRDGSALVLTTARMIRSDGSAIEEAGVTPDVAVEQSVDAPRGEAQDALLRAALQDR
jgi:carboxyl-terminal processing protease